MPVQNYLPSEKQRARHAIHYAIKQGKLDRPKNCSIAGCRSTSKIQAHHWKGYDQIHWLDVQWLCPKHHAHYLHLERDAQSLRGNLKSYPKKTLAEPRTEVYVLRLTVKEKAFLQQYSDDHGWPVSITLRHLITRFANKTLDPYAPIYHE